MKKHVTPIIVFIREQWQSLLMACLLFVLLIVFIDKHFLTSPVSFETKLKTKTFLHYESFIDSLHYDSAIKAQLKQEVADILLNNPIQSDDDELALEALPLIQYRLRTFLETSLIDSLRKDRGLPFLSEDTTNHFYEPDEGLLPPDPDNLSSSNQPE